MLDVKKLPWRIDIATAGMHREMISSSFTLSSLYVCCRYAMWHTYYCMSVMTLRPPVMYRPLKIGFCLNPWML